VADADDGGVSLRLDLLQVAGSSTRYTLEIV